MKRILLIFFLALNIFYPLFLSAKQSQDNKLRVLYFYSETCHACMRVRQEIMPQIEKEFKDRIKIEYLSIFDEENYKFMLGLKEKYNCKEEGVPTVFIEGEFLVGYDKIKNNLRSAIIKALKEKKILTIESKPIDLIEQFRSFRIFTIITAGLVDGINPCAFTVIVFFISFLSLQGYKRRELLWVGLSFILAVFITYVLIGLGVFRFLYTLEKFYFFSRLVHLLIAVFCFFLSLCALYDLWIFIRTRKTDAMVLQLPKIVKDKIHYLIGLHYRKPQRESLTVKASPVKTVFTALILGFLISLLEAVCTGQLYLPTLSFVLKEPSLKLKALFYIILYNLMFILPLFLVLLFALLGATSENFSRFLKKHLLAIKLLMAFLFFLFGLLILLRI